MAIDLAKRDGIMSFEAQGRHNLERADTVLEDGRSHWRVTGNDPHFSLLSNRAATTPLAAGWYSLAIDLAADRGGLKEPRLYLDFGDGLSEESSIDLTPLRTMRGFDGIVCLVREVSALRFDPSTDVCEFTLGSVTLRPLGRFSALIGMIRQIRGDGLSYTAIGKKMLPRLIRSGVRGVGRWIYEQHLRASRSGADHDRYAGWVWQYDTIDDADRVEIGARISKMQNQPLISIVLPVFNTPEKWLRRCLDTVIFQLYPNWELCIADDASPQPHVRKVLDEYVRRDKRIKVVFRERNGHISESSNSAIKISSGEYIALIDHDDELPEHALYMVAEAINAHPGAKLIYSDEDKIDERGIRFDPYFKSDWNPDLFRGHNMVSHLGVYKSSVVRDAGGFRVGYEGSQDYDLALRITERAARHEIVHIPHVLYHWRAIAGSTALSPGEKSYAHVASRKALTEHLQRVGLKGEFVEMERFQGNWSFSLDLVDQPKISIIVPTRDGLAYLIRCIESIRTKSTYKNVEIIVVDNQSKDPDTLAYLHAQSALTDTQVLRFDHPFNFSTINNFAAARATGELLLFLNNDTEVITGKWLEEMAAHAVRPEVGAVGAMLYYPNDTVQHAGIVLGLGEARIAGHSYHLKPRGYPGQMCRMHLVQEVSAVTAACLMVRRSVFDDVGKFDESFPVAFNDVDLCLRIRQAGYSNIWTPRAELYHYESVTRGSDLDSERKARFDSECDRFKARWGGELVSDPYFNANLRLDRAGFEFGGPRGTKPWRHMSV